MKMRFVNLPYGIKLSSDCCLEFFELISFILNIHPTNPLTKVFVNQFSTTSSLISKTKEAYF